MRNEKYEVWLDKQCLVDKNMNENLIGALFYLYLAAFTDFKSH